MSWQHRGTGIRKVEASCCIHLRHNYDLSWTLLKTPTAPSACSPRHHSGLSYWIIYCFLNESSVYTSLCQFLHHERILLFKALKVGTLYIVLLQPAHKRTPPNLTQFPGNSASWWEPRVLPAISHCPSQSSLLGYLHSYVLSTRENTRLNTEAPSTRELTDTILAWDPEWWIASKEYDTYPKRQDQMST